MKKSVFDIISERILEQLEEGVVLWQKPWDTKAGMQLKIRPHT